MSRCVQCGGTGRVRADAQPGYKESAGMGMAVCRGCGGSGVVRGSTGTAGSATPIIKSHPVVWVFAIMGGIFGSAMSAVGVNVLVGALGGFFVLGAASSMLMTFRTGRRILIGIALLFVAMLALGAFLSK